MTTAPASSSQPPATDEMCTQNDHENTIRTPSVLDSFQIQKLDVQNDEERAENDSKPAQKAGPKTKRQGNRHL